MDRRSTLSLITDGNAAQIQSKFLLYLPNFCLNFIVLPAASRFTTSMISVPLLSDADA